MIGIIFIGAPCSGKSTIAKAVCERLGLQYISSGDISRNMAIDDDDIKQRLNNGGMTPEALMRGEMAKCISECRDANKSFILDGFPRFLEQYEWLVNTFPNIRFICIYIETSISTIYSRHNLRGRCDDTHDVFTQRIRYFINETMPLLNVMDNVHKIHNNDASINELIDIVCIDIGEELDANNS